MKKAWWKEAVAYQIYPRSFMDSNGDGIGDIPGIISKLDYLKDLGIDVIWISPMYASPNDDNGYDISNYQEIMAEFGTMADFDRLLEETHCRGMKLILDLVINHTSDEHPWFIESRSGLDSPKRDWYIWRDGRPAEVEVDTNNEHYGDIRAEIASELIAERTTAQRIAPPNNWESIFGGPAWEFDAQTGQYYLHIFSTKQPDLNWENREVRAALYDMINWWLEKGIDGFRVDAISHIKKEPGLHDMPNPHGSQTVPCFPKMMNVDGIHPLLQELKEETFAKHDIMTVGEANGVSVNNSYDLEQWVSEDKGHFNMVFQFEHLALWDAEAKKELNVVELKEVLSRWQKGLENKGWNALFIENHDKPRIVSTWGDDGNHRYESATAFATMYFLMQGTPFIYQGQEIGMTNVQYESIEDYNDVAARNLYNNKLAAGVQHEEIMNILWQTSRDNSRTPMQWSAEENAGFTNGNPWLKINQNYVRINVEVQSSDPDSVLNFYKRMIALKKSNLVFTYGVYDLLDKDHPHVYAYTRTLAGQGKGESSNEAELGSNANAGSTAEMNTDVGGTQTGSGDSDKIIIITNLSTEPTTFHGEEGMSFEHDQLLLGNYAVTPHEPLTQLDLKPYEARVYRLK